MPPRRKPGSPQLGQSIRARRLELGRSIEEVALKAGVGAKTWGRYETGGSIRLDKVQGVARALGWHALPDADTDTPGPDQDNWLRKVDNRHEAWSPALEQEYGHSCALTFAVGSDLLLDHLTDDLDTLACMPTATHLGQLDTSWVADRLPPQFLPRYDYEFVYRLRAAVHMLRLRFAKGHLQAFSPLKHITLRLILSYAELFADTDPQLFQGQDHWTDWLAGVLGDLDVDRYLCNPTIAVPPGFDYHFDRWDEEPTANQDAAHTAGSSKDASD
ncbi:MAG: helix-turn-helix domain-containing protein [Micrococcales bacterium]|nr:helix-turn-helix domain-containing protein [Micrococcales bacterium]